MRSLVISELFRALPAHGVSVLRFNFRGVEGSGGRHDGGDAERLDARAALQALRAELPVTTPAVLAGWSFGADVALSVHDQAVTGWLAVACPLHYLRDADVLAHDPRPKLVLLAEHDEVRPPQEAEAIISTWAATEVQVVAGASHVFAGRTDVLVERAVAYLGTLGGPAEPTSTSTSG